MKEHRHRSGPFMCLATLLLVLGTQNRASAQDGQGQYVTQATGRLTKLIGEANKEGYSLQDNSLSIGGGWLKPGQKEWVQLYTVELVKGQKYRFIAAGDADAKDVDLQVQDANGKVVAEDVKTDPEAVVHFKPEATGKFTVRLRLYESRNDLPCVCLAIILAKKE